MMQRRHALPERVRRRGGEQPALSKAVCPDAILKKELANPGTDGRCGVNLICRPPEYIRNYIFELEAHLRKYEPGQYYYPPSDLHLTLFEVCHSRTPEEAEALALVVRSHLDELIAAAPPVTLGGGALAFDRRGCAVNFVSIDNELQRCRQHVDERLIEHDIPTAPRYAAASAHVTLMRYIKPLTSEPKEWARHLLDAPRRPQMDWTLSEVWITWGANWYGMRSRIVESGPFRLGNINEVE